MTENPSAIVSKDGEGETVAKVFPIVISVAALGPTLLAMAGAFAAAQTVPPLKYEAVAICAFVSSRGQNAAARWMLLGPGFARTPWLLGMTLLSADWLVFGVFLRMLTGPGMDGFGYLAGATKALPATFALAAWGCVFLASATAFRASSFEEEDSIFVIFSSRSPGSDSF